MSKTFTAPFAQTPRTAYAVTTAVTASISTDAPTNTVLLLTAGSDGSIVTRVWVMPRATNTATSHLLFLSKDGGTTKRLIDSEVMAAYTYAVTTAVPETQFSNYSESTPLRLEAGDSLYVGSQVALASGFSWKAEYTDF